VSPSNSEFRIITFEAGEINELKERMEHDVPAWDRLDALPHSLTSEEVAVDNR